MRARARPTGAAEKGGALTLASRRARNNGSQSGRRLCVAFLTVTSVPALGQASALDPAGAEASSIATLFWAMVVGGALLWLFVVSLMLYGIRRRRRVHDEWTAGRLIFWAGAVFPVVTLFLLLGYALWLMPQLRPWAPAQAAATLRIEVEGRQFWWRAVYHRPGDQPVVTANEIRLPVGERVEFTLTSSDVIHSFWIPPLGGKMDMIPGRTNRLSILATKPGTFRGPCAEFCGASHALMAFSAISMEPEAFRSWLAAEAGPARPQPSDGARLFVENGCGACHTIRGTAASGEVGPDLTHVGSRLMIGAGTLPNTEEAIARFIAEPDVVKPGSTMPPFRMLPETEIRAMAAYLKALQ
ncbi:cytochrome c oxidase subunit II [Pseudaminobacter soli (ex Zhang et al. 2022)]|uniref:cytochrome c oxidase subunit II n=1 Tax=Pseudaminobacter soli (ex Zhang et al. 2022) TaxID=2831468 RepID=UPI002355C47D|nr:cytochrome c oxidase subunit II [Pseudaminobacter soli]